MNPRQPEGKLPESLFCDQCGTMQINNKTRVMPCAKHNLHAKLVAALEACTDFLHGQYLKDIEALLKEAKK